MATINIIDWPAPLACSGGTLLDTALQNGVPFPFSCGTGECGACKARLLCGEVEHEPSSNAILSDEERREGHLLACRARPRTAVTLQAVDELVALPESRSYSARVLEQERLAHDVVRLRLSLPKKRLDYFAGQYFRLKFRGVPVRAYSVASLPDEEALEFHVRIVPDGKASGRAAQPGLVGTLLTVDGPYGRAYFRDRHAGPIIAAAGGTGLAPMLGIVRAALRQDPGREIHLYFGARAERDVYFEAQLQALAARHENLHLHIVLSQPEGSTRRRRGLLHEAIAADWAHLAGFKVYVAGPPPMVDAIARVSAERGVAAADLHTDPFSASSDHAPDGLLTRLREQLRDALAGMLLSPKAA